MVTYLDLDFYYVAVAAVMLALAGQWGFRRVKSLFTHR